MNNKENTTKKKFLKIFSLLAAIVIWVFINHSEDPLINHTMNYVEVNVRGESVLHEKGLMVINKKDISKTSFKIRGKRGDLINVMDSISASVDVSQIADVGEYGIRPDISIPSSTVNVTKQSKKLVDVEIAKLSAKTVPIKINQINADKVEGYIFESVPKMQEVLVKGEKNDLELIDHVAIDIDVSQISNETIGFYNVVYKGVNGSAIEFANDIIGQASQVEVVTTPLKKVTAEVNLKFDRILNDSYDISIIDTEKKTVTVGVRNDNTNNLIVDALLSGTVLELGIGEYDFVINSPKGIYIPKESQSVKASIDVRAKTGGGAWSPEREADGVH